MGIFWFVVGLIVIGALAAMAGKSGEDSSFLAIPLWGLILALLIGGGGLAVHIVH